MELKLKLILILVTVFQINTKEPINFDKTLEITKDSFSRDLAIYFTDLASYGYCSVEMMASGKCCSEWITKENWKLEASFNIDFSGYNMAVLKNDEYKKIVLTFPGTRGIPQFMEEAINSKGISLENDEIQKIMFFFNNVYISSQKKIKVIISEMMELYPNYQYIFTGHSLGGAIASIFALDSVKYGGIKYSENNPVLITYGQPRTGNAIFANEVMKYVPIVFRVVRSGDIVPHIPFCIKTNFLSTQCKSNLPQSKFSKNLILTETQIENEKKEYLQWHIGGLKLFNNEMSQFVDCGNEFGENHPDVLCKDGFSLNISNHSYYFNKRISKYCKTVE